MEMVTRWSVTWWWSAAAARLSVGVPERRRASSARFGVCALMQIESGIKCCCYWWYLWTQLCLPFPPFLPLFLFFGFSLSWQPRRMFERVGGAAFFSVPGQTAVLRQYIERQANLCCTSAAVAIHSHHRSHHHHLLFFLLVVLLPPPPLNSSSTSIWRLQHEHTHTHTG